jgi:hypothetical protein
VTENIKILIIIVVHFVIGYFLTKFLRKQTTQIKNWLRLLILSFSYAIIFGIGIVGSGGDPGFAFPCPIFLTGLIYISDWISTRIFINGFLIPLVFWWTLIFLVMFIRDILKNKEMKKIKLLRSHISV